jgi:hypothetical protein
MECSVEVDTDVASVRVVEVESAVKFRTGRGLVISSIESAIPQVSKVTRPPTTWCIVPLPPSSSLFGMVIPLPKERS